MQIKKWLASALSLALFFGIVGVAVADNVYNNLDGSIDATLESMTLTAGGPTGTVSLFIQPTNGDGKSGCNLVASTIFSASVSSNDPSVTVSPSSVTFTSCGDVKPITVTGVSAGTATVSLAQTADTTAGSFNLLPASFTVTVNPPVPSDVTAPEITPTVTPAPNANGWNNSDVTVIWTVNDPESDITSTSGCDTTVLTDETAGTTLTCSATSLGGTSTQSVTVKIDKTAPVITGAAAPAANGNGWNNTPVAVGFTCADTGAVQSGVDVDTVAGDTLSADGAGQSVTNTGSCVDAAGNAADAATVGGINIDQTAPVITLVTPANGGAYTYNQTVLADWSVSDALSGVDTSSGTTASGAPISTTPVMNGKTYTVTATDLAGNTANVTNTYDVVPYTFAGCQPPLSLDSKTFKQTSTIPVKCTYKTTTGAPVSIAVISLKVDGSPAVASGGSNTGNLFRFSPTDGFWIFNLSTKQFTKGTHALLITADDGSTHPYTVTVK
jgi:hypothetical protein